jgi:enoyl-[acyl-carrier-protein] reductase (NADH)
MDPKEAEERRNLVPLKTITTKENLGNIAFFLASENSQNMTGSVMFVDGGMDCLIAGGY